METATTKVKRALEWKNLTPKAKQSTHRQYFVIKKKKFRKLHIIRCSMLIGCWLNCRLWHQKYDSKVKEMK